jgi:hypothetical protein
VTAAVLVAAVAAVLAPDRVVFVDTVKGAVVRSVELPGEGLAIFAAPDGRVLVPLQAEDATAVVTPAGSVERWPGRLFPLFFSQDDRMYVVLQGALATLSYPERLPLERFRLDGVPGARRAACSWDGEMVAIIPAVPGGRVLLLAEVLGVERVLQVGLAGEATHVVLAPNGAFAVTAAGESLEVVVVGEPIARPALATGGLVRALCLLPNEWDVAVGLERGGAGEILVVRADPGSKKTPLRERSRVSLPAPVTAVAVAGEEVAAISGDVLVVLSHGGRKLARQVAVPEGRDLAVLPEKARTSVPTWGDALKP